MNPGVKKLIRDMDIITAMAAEMDEYLLSDVLYWPLSQAGMPRLTLGGYLMRQYRLLLLKNLLDDAQNDQVQAAVFQYNRSLEERIVRFEQKGHRELEARFRQFAEYLKDVDRGIASSVSNFSTAVESRAMIAAIIQQLEFAPYKLDRRVPQQVILLDTQLSRFWQSGDFIWPEEWMPAYPKSDFWWLYGKPKDRKQR